MKRLLKWLLVLTIVVAAALTFILFNPLFFKSQIEHFVSKKAGYEVSFDGELHLSIGKELSVQATDIHVLSALHHIQPELATVGALRISLETASMFSTDIVLSQLQLADASIALNTSEDGVSNWKRTGPDSPQAKPPVKGKSLKIKNIQIDNSTLNYQQHETSKNQLLKVTRFVQSEGKDGLLHMTLDGTFNDRPVTFDGDIGTFANIINGRDISFDGKGQFGPISISGNGLIDDVLHPKQPSFNIKMFGPNIKDVTAMFKTDDLGDGPFDLKANGQESNGHYSASLEGNIGAVDLRASARAQQAGSIDELAVTLDASGPKLGALARAFGQKGWPDQPFKLNSEILRSGPTVNISPLTLNIGGADLLLTAVLSNFPRFDPSTVSLSVEGDDVARFRELLGIKGVATGPFNLQAGLGLADKNIKQLQAYLKTALGDAEVSGILGEAPGYGGTRVHLKLNGQNAHRFMSIFDLDALPEKPFSLESDIHLLEEGQQKTNRINLQNIKLELADFELTGSAGFNAQKPLDSGTASLHLSSKDIANLKHFPTLGKTAALFVPDQPFNLSGDLSVSDQGWALKGLHGEIGRSALAIEGALKPGKHWADSTIRFNVEGPGLHLLLASISSDSALKGAFTSSGELLVSNNMLKLAAFKFKSGNTHATLNGSRAWPIVPNGDLLFDLDWLGEDISRFYPVLGGFKPAALAFNINATGKHQLNQLVVNRLDANFGGLQLTLSGDLQRELNPEEANAHIQLKSTNISDLGRYNDKPLPKVNLMLAADVHGNQNRFDLKQLETRLGASDLSGTLKVSLQGPKPDLELNSTSKLLDFRPFLSPARKNTDPLSNKNSADRMIPAIPLPMDLFNQFTANIDAQIEHLKLKTDSLNNVVLKAGIKGGVLDVSTLTMNGQRGTAASKLTISPGKSGQANVVLDLRTAGLVLKTSDRAGFDPDKVPALDLIVNLQGQGNDLRQIAGSATGSVKAGSEGGTIDGVSLGVLDNYILNQIFSLIMPKSKANDNTELTCAAVIFEIDNGVATTNPALAFTTNKITVLSKGTLDLSSEKLNFDFKATPNNALKVSASEILNSFIVVGGTLSKPVVGLDPTKVLFQGGAAIGTIGISLLARGLMDRVGNTVPVCHSMLADTKQPNYVVK